MAFISCAYTRHDPATDQYTYTIVDSDFGDVEISDVFGAAIDEIGVWVAIVSEYSKRGLPVGKNLALLVLYMHKEQEYDIADIKRWQDEHCSKHIENWAIYAKERDEHLTKLLALM